MAYERLKKAVFSQFSSPSETSVSTPIRGTGKLPVGTHAVTITGVDTLFLHTRGQVQLTFSAGAEMYERLTVYLYTKDNSAYSFRFRKIIRALFLEDALDLYADLLEQHTIDGLQLLRGLKLNVEVDVDDGYTVLAVPGGYSISTHSHKVFQTMQDLVQFTTSNNLRRATTQIVGVSSYGQLSNTRALHAAIETLRASSLSTSSTCN